MAFMPCVFYLDYTICVTMSKDCISHGYMRRFTLRNIILNTMNLPK